MPIDRRPPPIEDIAQRLAAHLAINGARASIETLAAARAPSPSRSARRERSLKHCHLPAEPKPRHPSPRDTGGYVPEMAARIDNDRNLTDGARRCARKLAEYVYRKGRDGRAADITVTWLMTALGKSRRTVQRYLRALEREGYIAVDVLRAGTRMCTGLAVKLLEPLFPRHGWPQKPMKPDMPFVSHKDRFRNKIERIPRDLWALRCMDPIWKAWQKVHPPLSDFQSTA